MLPALSLQRLPSVFQAGAIKAYLLDPDTKADALPCMLQVVWHGYVQSMRQALFSADLGLYVASGLLTYGANDGEHSPSLSTVS